MSTEEYELDAAIMGELPIVDVNEVEGLALGEMAEAEAGMTRPISLARGKQRLHTLRRRQFCRFLSALG